MTELAPWMKRDWLLRAEAQIDVALEAVGRTRTGPSTVVNSWARACVLTVPVAGSTIWIKYGYRLPPGEEKVLNVLAPRWATRIPTIVTTWDGAVAMEPLPGVELAESDPLEHWLAAARCLGELAAGESAHIDEWLALGVRDRRPAVWREHVESLVQSPVIRDMDAEVRQALDSFLPDFVSRYMDSFAAPATLVHQDSGCCNIHIAADGPVVFDWADVVVGHATFSCDRFLDQVPLEQQPAIVDAFLEPLDFDVAEFKAMRRSNVLHEVLRYHDELAYIEPNDPAHRSLTKSVQSQLQVLLAHEQKR